MTLEERKTKKYGYTFTGFRVLHIIHCLQLLPIEIPRDLVTVVMKIMWLDVGEELSFEELGMIYLI